ncbi:MAG: N-acetylmuramoyl-L-alanine amidase [Vicinamibacterales bacterium]
MIALARPVLSHRRFTAPPPPDEAALVPRPTSSVSKTVDTALFPLAIRTVVVDAGHGGDDHGTRAPLGLLEKDVTLDIATRLRALLAGRGYAAVMTRAADQAVPLRRRTQIANDARGDVLVSIHLNWISSRETRGVETYYLGPTDDPRLERLSAYENANSGLRLADLRTLLDELYADARQNESARLAGAVQRSLLRTLRRFNPTLENRGVKTAPFVVLTTSQMPAILAEVSCLSNDAEASLLADESYRERIASALADGVADFARTRARDPQKGTDDEF